VFNVGGGDEMTEVWCALASADPIFQYIIFQSERGRVTHPAREGESVDS
jgi:hypothetical protein